jgi:FMN phosphatase YigB (HAD superfamily)
MSIKAILWDFGDTLVDETWLQTPLEGHPNWAEVYRATMKNGDIFDDWNLGRINLAAVTEVLASAAGAAPRVIRDHMTKTSQNIKFFEPVMGFARQCQVPQAIVTINPDLFSHIVVPQYGLEELFPVIATSWEEETLSKAKLCDVALARLGGDFSRSEALLIDNKQENTKEWKSVGGRSYLFTNEERFQKDSRGLL